jgi:rare lipoprotein A
MGKRALAVALLAALAACVHGPRAEREPPASAETRLRPTPDEEDEDADADGRGQVGVASYYGHRFHGRLTASGTRYDMHALTCAHRTLPFGTRLRVTHLETGRTVVVTVTDRGPFARGRVVDLSLEAAKRLGIVSRGVARVRVERVADD